MTLAEKINDDDNLIACVTEIFTKINSLSGNILFSNSSDLSIMGFEFYFAYRHKPLRDLWHHASAWYDWEDTDQICNFFDSVANMAYEKFGDNWLRIWNAYFLKDYEPLENYDMTQTRTPNLRSTTSGAHNTVSTIDNSSTEKVVPWDSSIEQETSGSEGSSTTTEAEKDNKYNIQTDETGTDTLTRRGNIGVTTSQQMLDAEIRLRRLDFEKRVFHDIESILFRAVW